MVIFILQMIGLAFGFNFAGTVVVAAEMAGLLDCGEDSRASRSPLATTS